MCLTINVLSPSVRSIQNDVQTGGGVKVVERWKPYIVKWGKQ